MEQKELLTQLIDEGLSERARLMAQLSRIESERAKLHEDIAHYDFMIRSLRERLNPKESTLNNPTIENNNRREINSEVDAQINGLVSLSKTQAARRIIGRFQRPMSTKELIEVMQKNGVVFSGKNPMVNLFGILKDSKLIAKAGPGKWTLPEWAADKTASTRIGKLLEKMNK